jgi:hypothetical protein
MLRRAPDQEQAGGTGIRHGAHHNTGAAGRSRPGQRQGSRADRFQVIQPLPPYCDALQGLGLDPKQGVREQRRRRGALRSGFAARANGRREGRPPDLIGGACAV